MKTLIRLLNITLIISAVIAISSCEKGKTGDTGKGKAEFSLNLPGETEQLKSVSVADSGVVSYQLLVSVEDLNGNPVLSDSLIPLYPFGSGFVSENVELTAGEFRLTKFMVINPVGTVMFAAPLAGSPLAYLSNRPLPLGFNIFPGKTTRILPEVLAVGDQSPDQFGYANFGMQIIKPLVFWTVCILDNPLIVSPTQMTQAKLTVYANNSGWHYTFKLEAAVNRLVIRAGSEIYTFLLEKEGYLPQKLQFSAKDLLATSKENPLVLKIPWNSTTPKVLVLQPSPEAGKDAMISNLEPDKNFGAHRYFEATFLSEPILTVMRSNRSLIWFDMNQLPKSAVIKKVVLTLWYDVPVHWDSTVFRISAGSAVTWCGGVLQQITEPWEEGKVTWNTQPESVEANQVLISPFIRNVNFIDIDVTRLYIPVNEISAPNYGMFFKIYPTERFPGFRFASSDFPEPGMRPKLTIHYTLAR